MRRLGPVIAIVAALGCQATPSATLVAQLAPAPDSAPHGQIDGDEDGWTADLDCDDTTAAVHPGAFERCDGIDNDCDGLTDGQHAYDAPLWFRDDDGDGRGLDSDRHLSCSEPAGYVREGGDCDDGNPDISPLQVETCDGVDNDCDGSTDETSRGSIAGCPEPPYGAEARCVAATCDVVCADGMDDSNGDLTSVDSDGCETAYRGPRFVDVTEEAGLIYQQQDLTYTCTLPRNCQQRLFTGGAAVADLNGDSWPDLYVTRTDNRALLFLNQQDGTFDEQGREWGLGDFEGTVGPVFGDIDNDGDLDLFVTRMESAGYLLYLNVGNAFVEVAAARGVQSGTTTARGGQSASFGDYDRDGYLDLHVTEWRHLAEDREVHSHLYRNRGAEAPGFFEDVTATAGVALRSDGAGIFAFTTAFTDLDEDGWPDLVVAGDFGRSELFWNNGDGTFTEDTAGTGVGTAEFGMGGALGDIDGDGHLDWFVTSTFSADQADCVGCPIETVQGNRLFKNYGDRTFADITDDAGVRDGNWGWGALFFDYDYDGDLDLVQATGYIEGLEEHADAPMRLWRNRGGLFEDQASVTGLAADTEAGRALVALDYDGDGDLDFFVANNRGSPRLYRNDQLRGAHRIRIVLESQQGERQAIGARVELRATSTSAAQVRELRAGGTFLGQDEAVLHFGLGHYSGLVHEVRVLWPDGSESTYSGLASDRKVTLVKP